MLHKIFAAPKQQKSPKTVLLRNAAHDFLPNSRVTHKIFFLLNIIWDYNRNIPAPRCALRLRLLWVRGKILLSLWVRRETATWVPHIVYTLSAFPNLGVTERGILHCKFLCPMQDEWGMWGGCHLFVRNNFGISADISVLKEGNLQKWWEPKFKFYTKYVWKNICWAAHWLIN